jgi:hypothetical protein
MRERPVFGFATPDLWMPGAWRGPTCKHGARPQVPDSVLQGVDPAQRAVMWRMLWRCIYRSNWRPTTAAEDVLLKSQFRLPRRARHRHLEALV